MYDMYTFDTRTRSFVRSFVPSSSQKASSHASDDRASDARVDRRGGAGASFAESFAGFFLAVDFAAGLSLAFSSPAVFSAGRGVFRGLPTGRFAVEGFSAVAWIASRGGRTDAGVSASGAVWPRFGFAAGVRRVRGVSSGSSGSSAFFFFSVLAPTRGVAPRAAGALRVDVCFGGDGAIRRLSLIHI